MRKFWLGVVLAVLFLVAGFLVLYQQFVSFGAFFEVKDIHHETIALSLFALGIGVLIGLGLSGKKR